MKNTVKVLGFIALAAVIGFTMAACKNNTTPNTDSALNGTWTYTEDGVTVKVIIGNGTIVMEEYMKGTFTTSGSIITITPTHYWGTVFEISSLQAKWYSKAELKSSGATEIDEMFSPMIGTYLLSGNTLTITDEEGTTTLTKS